VRTHNQQVAVLLALLSLAVVSVAWGEVIGKTARPLDGKPARVSESTLGDLVADAVRASLNANIAFVQASQIRPGLLPTGDLTREALVSSLLFPDEPTVVVEMPGRMVKEALERGLAFLPRPSTMFLQVSGVSVTFRATDPLGRRISEITVGGAVISADKTYQVAMPGSLAKGAMGYDRVFTDLKIKQTGPSLSEALTRYVRANPNVNIVAGQRLRDLSRTQAGGGKQ